MRSHPWARTLFSQAVAMTGFVAFLLMMYAFTPPAPVPSEPGGAPVSAAVFLLKADDVTEPEASEQKPAKPTSPPPQPKPREPERFRPARQRAETSRTAPPLPTAAPRPQKTAETLPVPPRDLPLSYLMQFADMAEFHAFLDQLPERDAPDRTMSLIRIEGLPQTVPAMRRLFESYRMQPFLFNPAKFNYLITADNRLLSEQDAIQHYVAQVGRYLREDPPNGASSAIRAEAIARARNDHAIRQALSDDTEFDRMQLGLASPHLGRFFQRLEDDTARQLAELTGTPVAVRDIARIDCRFREVNGSMVLVPWQAWLGNQPDRNPIAIWRE
jgi:hypothetical protein